MNNDEKKQAANAQGGQNAQPENKTVSQATRRPEAGKQDDIDKVEGDMNNGELGGGLKKEDE